FRLDRSSRVFSFGEHGGSKREAIGTALNRCVSRRMIFYLRPRKGTITIRLEERKAIWMAPDQSSSRTWRLQERKAMALVCLYYLKRNMFSFVLVENMEEQWDVSEDHDQSSFLGLGVVNYEDILLSIHPFRWKMVICEWSAPIPWPDECKSLLLKIGSLSFLFEFEHGEAIGMIQFPLWMEMMMVEVSKEKISRLLLGLFHGLSALSPVSVVSNFNMVVSSRMNLELPIVACASEVDLRALQWLPRGAVFINQFLLVVHPFKLKDDQQMGKLSRLLKGRFSTLLSLSSSNEEGSRCKLQVPSSSFFWEASLIFGNTLTLLR
ncbi:unnamed protein product, partial [Brassica rapa]